MLATRVKQKDSIFYFISYKAADLLDKVRFTSRYYFEGEEIPQGRISEHDEVAQSPCGTHINQMRLKCLLDAVPVLRSHNNNRRLPRDKTFAEKFADGVEEFRIAPVELHRMVVMTLGLGRHAGTIAPLNCTQARPLL